MTRMVNQKLVKKKRKRLMKRKKMMMKTMGMVREGEVIAVHFTFKIQHIATHLFAGEEEDEDDDDDVEGGTKRAAEDEDDDDDEVKICSTLPRKLAADPKGAFLILFVFNRMWRPRSRKRMTMIDAFTLPVDQLPVSSPV